MRKIYASPRIENLERLTAVMAEHGIPTRVTNRRVYEGSSYKSFSYARPGHTDNWPALWVVHANDHTRARQLMRDMGIETPTRYAQELAAYRAGKSGGRSGRIATRIRTAVMAALVIAVAIYAARMALLW
ncbi:MAG: hypothetical protein ACREPY_11435 [Rhodanobacteraceae bacterium]